MGCTTVGCTEHYACRLRAKAVQVSPAATPNRTHHKVRPMAAPSWEAGTIRDQRPDGSSMPILNGALTPIGVKEYGENRREIDAQVKALKTPSASHPKD